MIRLNNKGFTLVELLGVLSVLILILLIAIPSIVSTYERNKNKINEEKKEIIFSATEIYVSKYKEDREKLNYDSFLNGNCEITIAMLKTSNLITEDELLDSNGNVLYSDDVRIKYNNNGTYSICN